MAGECSSVLCASAPLREDFFPRPEGGSAVPVAVIGASRNVKRATALLLVLAGFCGIVRGQDFASLFYPRTLFLESISAPGAIWANPGLLGEISRPTFLSSNVTPLGDRLVMATARICFPVGPVRLAAGVLGSGPYQAGSSQANATPSGFSASGSFLFSQPNLHIGAAYGHETIGSLGALVALGWESDPFGYTPELLSLNFMMGAGWVSPYFADHYSISFALWAMDHRTVDPYWELRGKLGARVRFFDDVLRGSVEMTFSLSEQREIAVAAEDGYEAAKLLLSLRAYGPLALLAGFSTDLLAFHELTMGEEANGNSIHAGIEIRETQQYPFMGGYEMAVSTTWVPRILHRIWLGYSWGGKRL